MVDWTKQTCGVHQASYLNLITEMPDLIDLIETFPEDPMDFTWDVKVHMLMPSQYPCIPNWHYDNIPRLNNVQDFSLVKTHLPMYLYVSGEPLTEFQKEDGTIFKIPAQTWFRFTQKDLHRGTISKDFQWRGFIRATHQEIQKPRESYQRRHSQVYLDAATFKW